MENGTRSNLGLKIIYPFTKVLACFEERGLLGR
jgi:hypothetical protein